MRLIKQTPLLWNIASQARTAIGTLARAPRNKTDLTESASAPPAPTATACVMGDMDLLRPLALAAVPCAVVGRPGSPSLFSRYAASRLVWDDYGEATEKLVELLVAFGTAQAEPPVLFYQEDGQTLLISRHRERLAKAFRFTIAEADLIEDLLDKARFQALAERHDLPVPTARRFDPTQNEPTHLGLRFPLIIKPLTRLDRWNDALGLRKARVPKISTRCARFGRNSANSASSFWCKNSSTVPSRGSRAITATSTGKDASPVNSPGASFAPIRRASATPPRWKSPRRRTSATKVAISSSGSASPAWPSLISSATCRANCGFWKSTRASRFGITPAPLPASIFRRWSMPI
jgi:hypothetical protein